MTAHGESMVTSGHVGPAGAPKAYVQITFWTDLLFKRGSLAAAEVMGILLLVRALPSEPFAIAPAILGAFLMAFGIAIEYLMWRKTGTLLSVSGIVRESTARSE
ncbi:MAG: hypothetical protein DMD40_13635 [Gemmatimonadetes bacterium]|nr:MAG: hypothetical protein DMD40_13635 [Gemmatimonadota bacterium]